MNRIQKLIHSKIGCIVISILLGLGLATIFRKSCKDRNCMVFYAPSFDKIKGKIYKFDNSCYTFKEKMTKCDTKRTVEFEPYEKEK